MTFVIIKVCAIKDKGIFLKVAGVCDGMSDMSG